MDNEKIKNPAFIGRSRSLEEIPLEADRVMNVVEANENTISRELPREKARKIGSSALRTEYAHENAKRARANAKRKILGYVLGVSAIVGISAGAIFVGGEKREDLEKMNQPVPNYKEQYDAIRHRNIIRPAQESDESIIAQANDEIERILGEQED